LAVAFAIAVAIAVILSEAKNPSSSPFATNPVKPCQNLDQRANNTKQIT
jgi:hypothetical protein